MTVAQHVKDAVNLTATKLKEKYPETYDSWRNMKQRAKDEGTPVHPDFEDFDSFLVHMGPRPSRKHTVDRKDYGDPEYSPEKCHWLDKAGQANNRSTTLWLTVQGETKSLMDWAIATTQKPDTLRSRLKKRWTHDEVVYGKKSRNREPSAAVTPHKSQFPWLSPERAAKYERGYRDHTEGLSPRPTPYEYYLRRLTNALRRLEMDITYYRDLLRVPELTDPLLPQPTPEDILPKIEWMEQQRDRFTAEIEQAHSFQVRKAD
ncbi:hypothetical protein ASC89_00265 [Devosia sp. Root413D1]|uniref:hypothetical protein n=1 Tax=Devosia sp. Root413D1 TaxID=1736531 RepID=UPI0006F20CF5|nr:hypothetical protein [Devosia sp. Root413D1]KQW85558.1 hypothetical protein ASC89_00265 [Devosia sp. Root413D1]